KQRWKIVAEHVDVIGNFRRSGRLGPRRDVHVFRNNFPTLLAHGVSDFTAQNDDGRLLCRMLPQKFQRTADHVGVERSAEPAFAADCQQQNALFLAPAQEGMCALRHAKSGGANQARNRASIGPGRKSSLLRTAQPRRRHEFHRPGNLLGIFYRTNAALDVELRWHGRLFFARSRFYRAAGVPAVNRSLNSERVFFRPSRISSSMAFFVAILWSNAAA